MRPLYYIGTEVLCLSDDQGKEPSLLGLPMLPILYEASYRLIRNYRRIPSWRFAS